MAAADSGTAGLDLYQLLGVPREASRQEIVQAWRRRAGLSIPMPGWAMLRRRPGSAF